MRTVRINIVQLGSAHVGNLSVVPDPCEEVRSVFELRQSCMSVCFCNTDPCGRSSLRPAIYPTSSRVRPNDRSLCDVDSTPGSSIDERSPGACSAAVILVAKLPDLRMPRYVPDVPEVLNVVSALRVTGWFNVNRSPGTSYRDSVKTSGYRGPRTILDAPPKNLFGKSCRGGI